MNSIDPMCRYCGVRVKVYGDYCEYCALDMDVADELAELDEIYGNVDDSR